MPEEEVVSLEEGQVGYGNGMVIYVPDTTRS